MFKKPNYPEVDPVVLKPIKGVRPGVYILAILCLGLLAILFVLGLLPGLVSSSSYISFSSPVSALAVYEDGQFLGNAAGTVLRTEAGPHQFTYIYKGIELGKEDVSIKRHFFFTLFAHRVQPITPSLSFNETAFNCGAMEFAESISLYSAVVNYDRSYNYPPLFQNIAKDAKAFGIQDMQDLWLYGALHITSETMFKDYLEGKKILDDSTCNYQSQELEKVEAALVSMFDSSSKERIEKKEDSIIPSFNAGTNYCTYEKGSITIGESSPLSYPETNILPATVDYDEFSIANTVVTEYDYALFVNDNPKWAKSNLDTLKAEGLVDDYYLGGITLTTAVKSKRPIRNVSYYAAKAYVEWLSSTRGVEYSLPTEVEWTVAARSTSSKAYGKTLINEDNDSSSPIGMMGQLWEFTDTPYIPLARVSYEKALELAKVFDYDDIIVKGGSYANVEAGLTTESVGVLSKSSCSDFCGIRVVIR